jgi:O-antigen ligase
MLDRYRSPMASEHPAHLHDSYLQVLVTTGCLGLVAFLALCVGLVRASGSGPPGLRRATGLAAGVRLGVTAGVAGFLVAALFDHAFGDEPLLFLVFTLAGVAWAARGWGDPEAPRPPTAATAQVDRTRTPAAGEARGQGPA